MVYPISFNGISVKFFWVFNISNLVGISRFFVIRSIINISKVVVGIPNFTIVANLIFSKFFSACFYPAIVIFFYRINEDYLCSGPQRMENPSIWKIMQMSRHTFPKKDRMDITRLLHNFFMLLKPVDRWKIGWCFGFLFLTMHLWTSRTSMEKQS